MAEEEKNLNTAEAETPETPAEEPKQKGKKEKAPKESKADKKAAKDAKKEKAQLQKEWENSIITSKRVKREERRRKLKRAMLFMLVVALIITSVVYIMLLFLDENNVRITASSTKGKTISLSMDNDVWSPYLNGKGPDNMEDLSYSKLGYNINDQLGVTVADVRQVLLDGENFQPGIKSKEHYISFAFLLRNDGTDSAAITCDMTLEYDKVRNLQNCVRVMWGTSTRNHPERTNVDIYAALSDNDRLFGTAINLSRNPEDKYIEYVAYPVGSDDPSVDMVERERQMHETGEYNDQYLNGYFATTPFFNEDYVFNYEDMLEGNDIMYCYVVIWLEGSDFDCVDSALGGYVKMSINFTAH